MNGYISGLMRRSGQSFSHPPPGRGPDPNRPDGGLEGNERRTLPLHIEETIVTGRDDSPPPIEIIEGRSPHQTEAHLNPHTRLGARRENGSAMRSGHRRQRQINGSGREGFSEERQEKIQEVDHRQVVSMGPLEGTFKKPYPHERKMSILPRSEIHDLQHEVIRGSDGQRTVKGNRSGIHENEANVSFQDSETQGDRSSYQREITTQQFTDDLLQKGSNVPLIKDHHESSLGPSSEAREIISTSNVSSHASEITPDNPADNIGDGADPPNLQSDPTLRDIIEWVGRNNEIETSDSKTVSEISSGPLDEAQALYHGSPEHPSIQEADNFSTPEPADNRIQDLSLSIGSISISVEGSENTAGSSETRYADRRMEKMSRGNNAGPHRSGTSQANRISRHYIRT